MLGQVTRLCDLTNDNDTVTSVSWAERGNFVAVGTHRGYVQVQGLLHSFQSFHKALYTKVKILTLPNFQIWDVAAAKRVNVLSGHSARWELTSFHSHFISFTHEVWNFTSVYSRVGALAWNGDMLSSGSRDRFILQRDVRTPR